MKQFLVVLLVFIMAAVMLIGALAKAIVPLHELRFLELQELVMNLDAQGYPPVSCEIMYWFEYNQMCYYSNVGPFKHISMMRVGTEVSEVSVMIFEPLTVGEIELALGPGEYMSKWHVRSWSWDGLLARTYEYVGNPTPFSPVKFLHWRFE